MCIPATLFLRTQTVFSPTHDLSVYQCGLWLSRTGCDVTACVLTWSFIDSVLKIFSLPSSLTHDTAFRKQWGLLTVYTALDVTTGELLHSHDDQRKGHNSADFIVLKTVVFDPKHLSPFPPFAALFALKKKNIRWHLTFSPLWSSTMNVLHLW